MPYIDNGFTVHLGRWSGRGPGELRVAVASVQQGKGPLVASTRREASDAGESPAHAEAQPAAIPDHELADIIFRAAALGIPAWRVATALGVPLPSGNETPGPP